ncbi:unnamed protein product [Leptidea sinapis]|uniref:Uncharacterized protein n=1 Tax=Leptidea sinapis TaxID=189913 RepID=A0A5E4PPH7_9NEOP|nr:unnamed protein product [Leptidea sinapis]
MPKRYPDKSGASLPKGAAGSPDDSEEDEDTEKKPEPRHPKHDRRYTGLHDVEVCLKFYISSEFIVSCWDLELMARPNGAST